MQVAKNNFKIDLHMHTAISDGSDSVEEIVEAVKREGISIFSITDHDSIKASNIIASTNLGPDTTFIPGVEFSCADDNGKYHILGYGIDTASNAIQEVIKQGYDYRIEKVNSRLEFIKNEYGFEFDNKDIEDLLALDNPGKPHIALLMVKYGYTTSKEDAIVNYINNLHVGSKYVRPEDAINGIIRSGGVPVLAHPYFGNGDQLILGDEIEERLLYLMNYGLKGVEAFYSGFTPKLIRGMCDLANKYNLYITAGSDYHGKNKLVRLGDTGLDSVDELPVNIIKFFEKISI